MLLIGKKTENGSHSVLKSLLSDLDLKIQESLLQLRLPSITRGLVIEITINEVLSNSNLNKDIQYVLCPIMELEIERLSDDNLRRSQGVGQVVKKELINEPFDFRSASAQPELFYHMQRKDLAFSLRVLETYLNKEIAQPNKVQDINNLKENRENIVILEDTYFICKNQRKGLFQLNFTSNESQNFKCVADDQHRSMFESNPVFRSQVSNLFEQIFDFVIQYRDTESNENQSTKKHQDPQLIKTNELPDSNEFIASKRSANIFLNKSKEVNKFNDNKLEQHVRAQRLYDCLDALYENTQRQCLKYYEKNYTNGTVFSYSKLRNFLSTLYDIEFATNIDLNCMCSDEELRQRFVNLLKQFYLDVPNHLPVSDFASIIENSKFVGDLPNLFPALMDNIKNAQQSNGSTRRHSMVSPPISNHVNNNADNQNQNSSFNTNYEYFPEDMDAVLKMEIKSRELVKNRRPVRTLLAANDQDLPRLKIQLQQSLKEIELELTADVSNYTVIWPININGNHWAGCVIYINPTQKTTQFRFIDTMGQTHPNTIEYLKLYLFELFGNAYSIEVLNSTVLQQPDLISCGPYFITHAIHYAYEEPLSYEVLNAARKRHVELLGPAFTRKQFQNTSEVNFRKISEQSKHDKLELEIRAQQLCDCIKTLHEITQAEIMDSNYQDPAIVADFPYSRFRELLISIYEIELALNNTSPQAASDVPLPQRFVGLLKQLYIGVPEHLSSSEFTTVIKDSYFAEDIPNVFAKAIQLLNPSSQNVLKLT